MNWWQALLTVIGTIGFIFLLAWIGEKKDWLFTKPVSPWKEYDKNDKGAKGP